MELKEAIKKLKNDNTFKEWKSKNPDSFMSYCLITIENEVESDWQLGFFQKNTKKITTFIASEQVKMEQEQDVFKKPDQTVEPINQERATCSFNEILEYAKNFQTETYPLELVNKTIAILQNLREHGTVWNITFITLAFKTLNMKINARSGKIIDHSLTSIMDLVQK